MASQSSAAELADIQPLFRLAIPMKNWLKLLAGKCGATVGPAKNFDAGDLTAMQFTLTKDGRTTTVTIIASPNGTSARWYARGWVRDLLPKEAERSYGGKLSRYLRRRNARGTSQEGSHDG